MDWDLLLAQTLNSPRPTGMTLYEWIQLVLGLVIKLAIPILVVLVVYWGFRVVASLGNDAEIAESRRRLKWAIIILAIFLGLALLATIIYNTGGSIGFPVFFEPN